MEPRLRRWLGVVGLVFVVLFVVSSFITPNTPDSHASVAKVVTFYHKHKGGFAAQAWIIEIAVLVGVFFFWYLRDYIGRTEAHRRLATVGFAGAVLFAVSGGVQAGISFSLADGVNHVPGTTTQSLNVLQNDLTVFLAGAGVATFLVATGLVCLLSDVLPRWLGWVGMILALASLIIPFFGPPAAGLWVLIASIVILVRERGSTSAPLADSQSAHITP